jgi:electron transport complex protein RnfC
MKSLHNKFTSNAIFKFHGGVHPTENKLISNSQTSVKFESDNFFRVLVNQSSVKKFELPIEIIVTKGQKVIQGEALTSGDSSSDYFYVPVHSPCDGTVLEIECFSGDHISGLAETTIVIEAQKNYETKSRIKSTPSVERSNINWKNESAEYLVKKIRNAGIVGLGGATFPTHIKQYIPLKRDKQNPATLIINAMECEPYITCDDRLIREQAKSIIEGALIVSRIVNCDKIIFVIEDNKPEAIMSLQKVIKNESKISILIAPTKYPSGGEKQLIQIVTGKELTKHQLPKDLNILVQNVATLFAVYQAILFNRNLTERLVTITGDLVPDPRNYWIPFGTPISWIIKHLNISEKDLDIVIIGGPLMGQKIFDFSIPTSKKVNCLIFNQTIVQNEIKDCIRCGECEIVCPIKLLPQQLYWFSKSEQWKPMQQLDLDACIECGACDYVCPSHIPLVDYFRFAKSEVKHLLNKENASEIAKQRFENREKRLIRIEQERKSKQEKITLDRQKASEDNSKDPEGKKAAILAALNRFKSKSQGEG